MGVTSEWVDFEWYRESITGRPSSRVSMYHSVPWLEVLANAFGAEIRVAHTISQGGRSLALTPFMVRFKGPFRLVGSPLSGLHTEFAGPLFSDAFTEADLQAVIESQHRLVACGADYIEWGAKGGVGGDSWGATLENLGYTYTPRSTILVDLSQGEEGVWSSFLGRARNMVRKAERAGVLVHTNSPTETWIDCFYRMLSDTFSRQGLAVPHPHSFYRALIGIAKLGWLRCVTAEINGRMIAGGIFLLDGQRMLYLSGASNADGMKLAGASLLQWHIMREAIIAGVTEYDMGGLGVTSIDKFKHSFGGRRMQHHRWVRRSPLFRLAEPAAQWAARKGLIRMWGG
jgi:CelD/BcsL family acetyltransferase involved in cellulose biosynthesis